MASALAVWADEVIICLILGLSVHMTDSSSVDMNDLNYDKAFVTLKEFIAILSQVSDEKCETFEIWSQDVYAILIRVYSWRKGQYRNKAAFPSKFIFTMEIAFVQLVEKHKALWKVMHKNASTVHVVCLKEFQTLQCVFFILKLMYQFSKLSW